MPGLTGLARGSIATVDGKVASARDEAVEYSKDALLMAAFPEDTPADLAAGEPLVVVEDWVWHALPHQ